MTLPVAIVEDEPWVRRLLIKGIDWKRLDLKLIVEADSGPTALTLCRQFRPRIVFTDIRIPGFDGLRLVERLKEELYGARYIIVSGHADFEYAQRALRMGVTDYLLKPVREEQVLAILLRVKNEIAQEESDRLDKGRIERQNKTLQAALLAAKWPTVAESETIHDPRIAKAIEIMVHRIAEQISLDEIAACVGMSRSNFAEHFRAETSQSFVEYLNTTRIRAAQSVLEHYEFSVAEVARMTGYTDPNYFIRVFRSKLLQTPGEYRMRLLQARKAVT